MGISALSGGLNVSAVQAKDMLSGSEKTFFDRVLHTNISESPEFFSNNGISSLSVQEMSYWSLELHNLGCEMC